VAGLLWVDGGQSGFRQEIVESCQSAGYFFVMASCPPLKLSILRDIGWSKWDPIGLQNIEGGWEGSSAADEYDCYLLHVASSLRNGHEVHELARYLIDIEIEHMGLSPSATTQSRAVATVQGIREYVDGLG
jgi:hypothetical protein